MTNEQRIKAYRIRRAAWLAAQVQIIAHRLGPRTARGWANMWATCARIRGEQYKARLREFNQVNTL